MNEELLYKVKKEYPDEKWDIYIFEWEGFYFSLEIYYSDDGNYSFNVYPERDLEIVKFRYELIPIENMDESEEKINKLYRLFEQKLDIIQDAVNEEKENILKIFNLK